MKTEKPTAKLNPHILDEASAWFVEFSEGEVSATVREEFDAWLRRSPEHIEAYLKIAALWDDTPLVAKGRTRTADELIARARADSNVVSLHLASQQTSGMHDAQTQRSVAVSPLDNTLIDAPRRKARFLAMAATLIIAMAGTATWYLYGAPTYTTDVGEQRSVRLSDGSLVEINSRSKLRVKFSERERLVELLEGQALFNVSKDENRPFVVDSNETRVRAVGTRFDVYRRSGGTLVTVLEGRVAVGSPLIEAREPAHAGSAEPPSVQQTPARPERLDLSSAAERPSASSANHVSAEPRGSLALSLNEVLLTAGQQLSVSPAALATPEPADIQVATAWTRQQIVFQSSTLSEVIEEFNRYNAKKMRIADPALQGTRISGVFSSSDANSLLRFLSALPNVEVQETADEIRIASK